MNDHPRPSPPRPLKAAGLTLWNDVHSFGDVRGNVEELLILCEQLDERSELRQRLTASGEWRDRIGLRQLDDRIDAALKHLGIRSMLPDRSGEPVDNWVTRLARTYSKGGVTYEWTDEEWAERQQLSTVGDQ
jgi:hypothetical protein